MFLLCSVKITKVIVMYIVGISSPGKKDHPEDIEQLLSPTSRVLGTPLDQY